MVDISAIGRLVDDYIAGWIKQRPEYGTGLYEDNDFGQENLQVFRSGYEIHKFTHDELAALSVLLTRSLRGQINRDHKQFWAWCSFLTHHYNRDVGVFGDRDWVAAYQSLVNLNLGGRTSWPAGPAHLQWEERSREFVNFHLLQVEMDKWLLSGPLAFAVLEGLLRRKNGGYVANDGSVHHQFQARNRTYAIGRTLNRIVDSLWLFERRVTVDRGRPCPSLGSLKSEILALYPTSVDVFEMIDSWRNDLVHGNEYWSNRVPIVLNLISLLIVDEIEPSLYDSKLGDLESHLQWREQTRSRGLDYRAPWDIFPPDL